MLLCYLGKVIKVLCGCSCCERCPAADVEEWSWIERRKEGGAIQLNSSKHSLNDLSRLAREGRRGVCPGASVFRDRDQLWIPLTEARPRPSSHPWHSLGER